MKLGPWLQKAEIYCGCWIRVGVENGEVIWKLDREFRKKTDGVDLEKGNRIFVAEPGNK